MKPLPVLCAAVLAWTSLAGAGGFDVAPAGDDNNPGTRQSPFRTIQHAAEVARPGDTITVHSGVYRERVNPPRGGKSDRARVIYQAAPDETVEIKGSEVVKGWTRVQDDVWKVTLRNSFFGGFNPYGDESHGDWFAQPYENVDGTPLEIDMDCSGKRRDRSSSTPSLLDPACFVHAARPGLGIGHRDSARCMHALRSVAMNATRQS